MADGGATNSQSFGDDVRSQRGHGAADSSFSAESAYGDGSSLRDRLYRTAEEIAHTGATLDSDAGKLWSAIDWRCTSYFRVIVFAWRFLIGLMLVATGYWIKEQAIHGAPLGGLLPPGAPAADIRLVADTFMKLGVLAGVGSLIIASIVYFIGDPEFGGVRRAAREIGRIAARITEEFDNELTRLRGSVDQRGSDLAKAAEDISLMHLAAFRATVFFRDVNFLTADTMDAARVKLAGWIDYHRKSAPAAGVLLRVIIIALLSFYIGVSYGYVQWAPKPQPDPAFLAGSLIRQYPEAAGALVLFGLIFGLVGIALTPMEQLLTTGERRKALELGVEAARSEFTGATASRIDAVVRRIDEAFAVYKARLDKKSGGAGSHLAEQTADDEPSWRKPPEEPRFVAPSFDAAPPSFTAKAAPSPRQHFFSKKIHRNAAPKQSFGREETPRWLKD